jgi:hypothetical protein
MKTIKLIAGSLLLLGFTVCSAQNNSVQGVVNSVTNTVTNGGTPSNDDIAKGLKEALKVGTNNSTTSASKVDGFYKNPKIKIPFPQEAKEMEQTVRDMGMGAQCDKFVETLNRGAEEAAKSAAPIFVKAITNLTISDGMKILKGPNDAATQYLKQNTNGQLKTAFLPVVKAALDKVEITKYWAPITTAYDKVPFVTKINPDLNSYVTGKAIDGLFKLIADEELKIRTDPAARISDILKQVFGL